MSTTLVVYGTNWCGDCARARRVLDAEGVRYSWLDIDGNPEAERIVLGLNHGLRSVPTILFPDGSVLVEPSARHLLEHLRKTEETVEGGAAATDGVRTTWLERARGYIARLLQSDHTMRSRDKAESHREI